MIRIVIHLLFHKILITNVYHIKKIIIIYVSNLMIQKYISPVINIYI